MNYCIHCMQQLAEGSFTCDKCGMPQNYECPVHHLKPGTILQERYLVGKALGEGGFGITYIGQDKKLEMRIAIKEYYPNGSSTRNHEYSNTVTLTQNSYNDSYEKEMQRFLNEARILAKLTNEPGIVDVRDFFHENGTAYIVMEFLDGVTLKNYVRQNGRMPVDQVLALMDPVMKGLGHIHSQGLIHRDVSPDNIMMLKNGRVKLLDFGAARDVSRDKSLSVVLKPGYAPEEQYRTRGDQGSWTDVYALCATMYKCITGITPDESLERVQEDNLKPPSALGISILPHQEQTLMQGLRVRRRERIQDMESLRQGFLAGMDEEQTKSIHVQHETDDDGGKTVYQPKPVYNTRQEEKPQTVRQEQSKTEKSVKLDEPPKPVRKPKKKLGILIFAAVAALLLIAVLLVSHQKESVLPQENIETAPAETVPAETAPPPTQAHIHVWQDADCETGKHCADCGAVDGEPLGHIGTAANYQDPSVCTRCGMILADPLQPDMEKYGITEFMEVGVIYSYTTSTLSNEELSTTGELQILSYEVFKSARGYPAKKGYEWHIVQVQIDFFDDNAKAWGASVGYCHENYYDINLSDATYTHDKETDMSSRMVSYHGEEMPIYYKETDSWSGWQVVDGRNQNSYFLTRAWLIPEGYDGSVLGFYNHNAVQWSNKHIYEVYDPENFLLFRLN